MELLPLLKIWARLPVPLARAHLVRFIGKDSGPGSDPVRNDRNLSGMFEVGARGAWAGRKGYGQRSNCCPVKVIRWWGVSPMRAMASRWAWVPYPTLVCQSYPG